MAEKIVAYKLTRSDCPGSICCGPKASDIVQAIQYEIETDCADDYPADERSIITLEPYETTQEEIDALPEFGGW